MDSNSNVSEALSDLSKKPLGNIKVLMIEDDKFITEIVGEKLVANGCIPYSSDNGEEAKALALQYKPDAIILDLMLPGMQGEEVLQLMKQEPELKEIPVIVFSNKAEQSDIDNLSALGAVEYLVKSATDLDELVEIVKKHAAATN